MAQLFLSICVLSYFMSVFLSCVLLLMFPSRRFHFPVDIIPSFRQVVSNNTRNTQDSSRSIGGWRRVRDDETDSPPWLLAGPHAVTPLSRPGVARCQSGEGRVHRACCCRARRCFGVDLRGCGRVWLCLRCKHCLNI